MSKQSTNPFNQQIEVQQDFSSLLLAWFDHSGRHDLPWQNQKTPYRVWVSEIMLQQTQVQTVIPYFLKFMASFPDLAALANASQDEVLAHWSGLGYYARGRNLHHAAKIVMNEYCGEFPRQFDEIVALPGIGRSTAAAILSIAFEQPYAILDGNVKRVLCRYDAVESWSGEKQTEATLWQRAENLMPQQRFADYTQAIMDLGATLCKRIRPLCQACPVQQNCQAYQQDKVARYPYSKPKVEKPTKQVVMLIALDKHQQLFLQKRPQQGIWGGLWSLPQFESESQLNGFLTESAVIRTQNKSKPPVLAGVELSELTEFKHTFTHYHLIIQPRIYFVSEVLALTGKWVSIEHSLEMGLPAPIRKIIKILENEYVKNGELLKNG